MTHNNNIGDIGDNVDGHGIASYFAYYKNAVKKYGNNALVMMRMGDFYEFYSYPDEGPNLDKIGKQLEIIKTRRDSKKPLSKYGNPELVGFNHRAEDKFVEKLMAEGYIIVVVEEKHETINRINTKGINVVEKKVTRHIDRVYSKSTYDNGSSDSNYLVSITIEEIKQRNGHPLIFCGMAAADLFTGKVFINESISSEKDTSYSLDACNRFIDTLLPKEILVNCENLKTIDKKYITDYLFLEKKEHTINVSPESKYGKICYQEEVLEKIYEKDKSMMNIIIQLELEKLDFARKALIHLIDFAVDHSKKITSHIDYPVQLINAGHMVLGNNAQKQLNVIKSESFESNRNIKCLFDVINKSMTHMGRRFIERQLTSPLVNCNKLQEIYDNVEIFKKEKYYESIRIILSKIRDIEKLGRKIDVLTINPKELHTYIMSLKECREILKLVTHNKEFKILKELDIKHLYKKIKKILKLCDSYFDYDKMKNFSTSSNANNENFINIDIDDKISNLVKKLSNSNEYIDSIKGYFYKFLVSSLITDKNDREKKSVINTNVNIISDRNRGHYIKLNSKKAKELKQYIEEKGIKTILLGDIKVKTKEFEYAFLKTDCKIFIPFLSTFSRDMDTVQESFEEHSQRVYMSFLEIINKKYFKDLIKVRDVITALDYYTTIAFVADLNHYVKPQIKENNDSFINAKNLRHPIVEEIIDHEYVPHSVELGKDLKGMLVYGINSSGKSVMMKAIGLSIIMAQAGFYVPADEFIYYPYQALYTRITGYDNLFKGQSSFAVGMIELNAIIKRSDNHTLVLGDEVGRSTENISAHAIVAATLIKLAKESSSFVFSTHLHDLNDIKDIQECKYIKSFHLSVENDEKTGQIIYDRILKEGQGDRVYGVAVAKSIIKCKEFMSIADRIKDDLLNVYSSLVVDKTSRYNSKKYMSICEVCGEKLQKDNINLETHHINFQKDFDENGVHNSKKHIKKNAKSNLLVVCQQCHDDIHNGKVKVNAVVMTSEGVKPLVEKVKS
jgi:DNA mismatch repair protein MutS